MRLAIAAFAAAFILASPAQAEVVMATASSFQVRAETEVAAPPDQAWDNLIHIGRWWNNEHTYSGEGARMELDARAGGCWCERWGDGQSVEHMRVVLVMGRDGVRTLRTVGGLGPLQEMGVSGVLTFTVASHPAGSKLTMSYRVAGDPGLNLDQLAPLVDMVLMEQFGRLSRYSASGSPD